jgi:hypothetical protein
MEIPLGIRREAALFLHSFGLPIEIQAARPVKGSLLLPLLQPHGDGVIEMMYHRFDIHVG